MTDVKVSVGIDFSNCYSQNAHFERKRVRELINYEFVNKIKEQEKKNLSRKLIFCNVTGDDFSMSVVPDF